jgi:hypothetical protein
LTQADLLKPSQLATYQVQNLRRQTEQQWKQAPLQGAIPTGLDENLTRVNDAVFAALLWLRHAEGVMSGNRLDSHYSAVYTAICNAIHESNTALNHIGDSPDDIYDVAHQGQPIEGKVHPPEPAFDAPEITDDFEF